MPVTRTDDVKRVPKKLNITDEELEKLAIKLAQRANAENNSTYGTLTQMAIEMVATIPTV